MVSLARALRCGLPLIAASAAIPFSLACDPPLDAPDAGDGGVRDAGFDAGRPPDTGPVRAIFALARTGDTPDFFASPWPSDLRLLPEGTPDLTGFPNPFRVALLDDYVDAIERRQVGYATNGAVYFRFSRSVDVATLPADAAATMVAGASVFLIDVDPDSPERGTRHPCLVDYEDRDTAFWRGETVTIRPVPGIALAGDRTYAAVVTRDVLPEAGGTFALDDDFAALLGDDASDPVIVEARATYQPALDALVELGVPLESLLSLAVFTTQDPTAIAFALRDWLRDESEEVRVPPDVVEDSWSPGSGGSGVVEFVGRYVAPVFQEGEIPYSDEGGAIDLDADGAPTLHGTYEARFSVTIPAGVPVPPNGFPLVLYSHGTGGDFRSYLSDDTAHLLAEQGYATMGIDQIHHAARNPTDQSPEVLFINLFNPDAVRFNTLESAIDIVQQARAAARMEVPSFVPIEGGPVRFDPERFYFFGHSQGGLVGPLFLGTDDSVRGGVISAGGALIGYAILEKIEPVSIPLIVTTLLRLPGGSDAFAIEGFDFDHPVITLLQGWIEPSDPANYGRFALDAPREGFAPKHILSTEGLRDAYVSPGSIEALAISMRVPLMAPVSRPVPAYELLGIPVMGTSVSLNAGGGLATAGLLQFPDDGHFAVFNNDAAMAQISGFFASLHEGETPTIPAAP